MADSNRGLSPLSISPADVIRAPAWCETIEHRAQRTWAEAPAVRTPLYVGYVDTPNRSKLTPRGPAVRMSGQNSTVLGCTMSRPTEIGFEACDSGRQKSSLHPPSEPLLPPSPQRKTKNGPANPMPPTYLTHTRNMFQIAMRRASASPLPCVRQHGRGISGSYKRRK